MHALDDLLQSLARQAAAHRRAHEHVGDASEVVELERGVEQPLELLLAHLVVAHEAGEPRRVLDRVVVGVDVGQGECRRARVVRDGERLDRTGHSRTAVRCSLAAPALEVVDEQVQHVVVARVADEHGGLPAHLRVLLLQAPRDRAAQAGGRHRQDPALLVVLVRERSGGHARFRVDLARARVPAR